MKVFKNIKKYFEIRMLRKEYIKEIEEDFLYNKYKLIKIIDLYNGYKRGKNPFTTLKEMGDVLYAGSTLKK